MLGKPQVQKSMEKKFIVSSLERLQHSSTLQGAPLLFQYLVEVFIKLKILECPICCSMSIELTMSNRCIHLLVPELRLE